MSSEFTKKSVLVVVGTTKFEDLIKAVSEERFQKVLKMIILFLFKIYFSCYIQKVTLI